MSLRYGKEGFDLFTSPPQIFWNPLGPGGFLTFLASFFTFEMAFLILQSLWQRNYAAKNNEVAVWGMVTGLVLSGLLLCLSFFIGISTLGFLGPGLRPMDVFTVSIQTVFPPLLGALIIVGLAAAIMSGADTIIMMATASISRDIYQRHFRPNASSRKILFFSRLEVLGFSCLGLIIAVAAEGIVSLLVLSFKTAGAGLAIPFLALMFWNKSTRAGVIWGMMAGILATIVPHFYVGQTYWSAAGGYIFSLIATIGASLLTSHAGDEQVQAVFYQGLDTDSNLNFGTAESQKTIERR